MPTALLGKTVMGQGLALSAGGVLVRGGVTERLRRRAIHQDGLRYT